MTKDEIEQMIRYKMAQNRISSARNRQALMGQYRQAGTRGSLNLGTEGEEDPMSSMMPGSRPQARPPAFTNMLGMAFGNARRPDILESILKLFSGR